LAAAVTDAQIRFAKQEEARSFIRTRSQPLAERAQQLQKTIDERQTRLTAYNNEIADLNQAILQAQTELPRLEEDIRQRTERLEGIQSQREQMHSAAKSASEQLQQMRSEADTLSRQESETNGKCVEQRMQRQYLIERVTGEHRISADAIQVEPEPEWPDQQRPEMEALELTIAELRAKLESMGSVNTDAIAEYKEQEERYQFLNSQQNDLLKSKQQLMDMIKTINQTTTEMFAKTFAEINENFQTMFKQLFGGGSAKLTLADEEDILECGIEIIARPPGKKLQSVSLLSGGERAMTAVALLFAIFMVKPSPFCVLDELDASLDESNIHRFIKVLQGFIAKSQFIIITHNRATISAANVLYGVTMAETGISKIVSMRFVDQSGKLEPAETSEKTDASQTEPANAITAER
jgi:chromosome segregation protein